jgi:hypothetical protein
MANEPLQKYFDSLLASYDILVDAVQKANDRGLKLSQQFASDVIKGQRDAIELGKKFAGETPEPSRAYSALLELTTQAQGRALAFAQNAYQEALAVGTDARETVQKLVDANRQTAEFAMEASRAFAANNPFADAIARGFEQFSPNGRTAAAPKAREKATA